jgi:nucleolar GTP-binding protein
MSFQEINKIEKAQVYLDMAFSKASKVNPGKGKARTETERAKHKELSKIDTISEVLQSRLMRVTREFPAVDNLNEFYSELLKVTLDYEKLKRALGSVNWAMKKVRDLHRPQRGIMRAARSTQEAVDVKKAFMGRVSSVMHQIDKNLAYLDQSRMAFREFPVIKEMPTVCIVGFPNVGKSTLLGKITTSKPEIKNYAFTTKSLNLGYMKTEEGQYQIIDAPGTLARPEKMNNIERQAYLALKYQADLILFVFDPTETYPVEQQEELYELTKKYRKPMIIYLSKTDIAEQEKVNWFLGKYDDAIADISILKENIIKKLKE